jgi:hypothetical protein
MPRRIQRQRTKGWKKPADAINCARPGKWGNPYRVGTYGRAMACHLFRTMLHDEKLREEAKYPSIEEIRTELKGHDLMCWCQLFEECHVDDLLRVANS